jgi:ribosome-binding protein aMBF1 (putative translation factor)
MSHSPCEWCGDDVKLSSIVNVVEQSGSAARVCRKCAAEDEAARELQAELAWGPPTFEEFALGERF